MNAAAKVTTKRDNKCVLVVRSLGGKLNRTIDARLWRGTADRYRGTANGRAGAVNLNRQGKSSGWGDVELRTKPRQAAELAANQSDDKSSRLNSVPLGDSRTLVAQLNLSVTRTTLNLN